MAVVRPLGPLALALALALCVSGCGDRKIVKDLEAASQASATPRAHRHAHAAHVKAAPTPVPTPSPNALHVAGDITLEDHAPQVVAMAMPGSGKAPLLRIEVRHRPEGSSQADSALIFFAVPALPGTYALHAPEDPPVAGRVYAYFTSRGEAVGSMKDFNSDVLGRLTLTREQPNALAATFQFAGQEPPPPPPPPSPKGQPAAAVVGTIPPHPPAHVQVTGTLLADLDLVQPEDASAPF
jgi:hypothetical protein